MSTIFTKIIEGEIPGRFVWKDEHCVAFLDIMPLSEGHLLLVPRAEVDRWPDLPAELAAHLFAVAHKISGALDQAFHIHLFPADGMADYDPANAKKDATAEELDAAAEKVRAALRERGHGEFVPEA